MKIYKYWVAEKQSIITEGEEHEITCYGGSNVSTEEARGKAREKAQGVDDRQPFA